MAIYNEKFTITTSQEGDFIDITEKIIGLARSIEAKDAVININVSNSLGSVFMIEIQENLNTDIQNKLESFFPISDLANSTMWQNKSSYAYLKALFLGHSVSCVLINNEIKIDKHQRIIFADFDNKQSVRDIIVSFTY